jgi:hypothetical protein
MKYITTLIVLIVSALFLNNCTTTQRDASKKYASQISREVARSAGIAAAAVATNLIQLKLNEATAKLSEQRATLGPKNPGSVVTLTKLGFQEIAVVEAERLLRRAEVELAKLKDVDALPAPAEALAPVVVTP